MNEQLTREQQAVADHPIDRPAVVDAGAGTGKTHTIVGRVEQLYHSRACRPDEILLLTFARKAAAELRRRVLDRLGANVEPPHSSTFHAFASSVLSDHAYDLRVSPDATVIEDIDARLEFRTAFDAVVYGPSADATAFPLRPGQRDALRDGLFIVAQQLKEREISIDGFRDRAIAAADLIERIPYRAIRRRSKDGRQRKAEAEINDEGLRAEAEDARARARAAADIFRRFEARLRHRHALTYADLLLLARRGIEAHPQLRTALRGRYRHCIVDEFQDTDDAQWRFLQTLFGNGLECVTVVGDPRQSIFGFRGATPENIGRFGSLAGSACFALSENRRSRQEILDLAHAIISADTDDEYPLVANRGAAGEQIVRVSSRFATPENPNPNAHANREAQAGVVTRRIVALLASGIAPRDIAILTRNKILIQPFTAALVAAGVPFRLLGGAGFYEASEIRDAIGWLRVLADPLDGQAVARLCASAACGISDATTASLATGVERDQTAFARRVLVDDLPDSLDADSRVRLDRLRALVNTVEPFASASLSVSIPETFDRVGLIEQHERGGRQQAVANIRKLMRLGAAFVERNREAQARDFVDYLDELERVEFDDREADPPAGDAVTIMTVHAAKGLEWPIVFVVDVWPQKKPKPLIWLDKESAALLCREGRDGTPLFHVKSALLQPDNAGIMPHEEDDREPDDADAEERRLFYVALTRARDQVHVLGGRRYSRTNPGGTPHAFVAETEAWLRGRGWDIDIPVPSSDPLSSRTDEFDGTLKETAATRLDALGTPNGPSATRSTAATHRVPPLSFSALRAFERCPRSMTYSAILRLPDLRRERAETSDDSVSEAIALDDADVDSLLASDRGRLVHRALERWAQARMTNARIDTADAYVAGAMSELGLRPKAAERNEATAQVGGAIRALGNWHIERAEAPFLLQFGDAVVTGFIDLMARDNAERTVILDYKTGDTPASEYALQLGLYREAARRAYGVQDPVCMIGRFEGDGFTLEEVGAPGADEVRSRVAAVAAGLRAADTRPIPGRWCFTCAYRAAPCDAYPRGAER